MKNPEQTITPVCQRSFCPTDENLILYPMLDEELFDQVDECLFRCQQCKDRSKRFDALKEQNQA